MKDDDGTSTGECYAPTDEYWYNKCMWKCLLCGNKNKSLGSSKKHIQKVHQIYIKHMRTEANYKKASKKFYKKGEELSGESVIKIVPTICRIEVG